MSINRITTLQQSTNMMNHIITNENQYSDLLEESSSGIKVNEASDDPAAAKKILNYKSEISSMQSYMSNIKTGEVELQTTTSALDQVVDQAQSAVDYATQAANGNYTQDDLNSIKSSVNSVISSIVSLANTDYNGKYIFSGTATSTQTYTATTDSSGNYTSISYNGTQTSDYQRYATISDGTSVPVNAKGSDVFGYYNTSSTTAASQTGLTEGTVTTSATDSDGNKVSTKVVTKFNSDGSATVTTTKASGLFGDLGTFTNALSTGDSDTISSCIDNLTSDINNKVLSNETKLGATYNQMDMTYSTLKGTVTNLTGYKSDAQNADLSETLTNLESTKVALQASYTLTSQVMSMSLLNYIK